MEKGVKILPVSELLQRSRPLTGASSLIEQQSISPPSKSHAEPSRSRPIPSGIPASQSPTPKILTSLNYPTLIVGTLTLPSHDKSPTSGSASSCNKCSCFSFSDGSSTICCDLLDMDVRIIGRTIHVLAWNFIPLKCGTGFLEIISWRLPECSSVATQPSVFPLSSTSPTDCNSMMKSGSWVHCVLESVSPVFAAPCANAVDKSESSRNVRGFLVQILVCVCTGCSLKDGLMAVQNQTEGQYRHFFNKPFIVYFCDSASRCYPVISKLIGGIALLSGLKKKSVSIGGKESLLMYVTTENALLHIPKLANNWHPARRITKGKGALGTYSGTVTGIYMQGMVVELDWRVLLLLTDQPLIVPHSLRVGAIVSVRNVHFVNPKFSWTEVLVLGACCRSSITTKCFSPYEVGSFKYSKSLSSLSKFIDSLAFSARLWVLLVVSSFKKQFAGSLSDKEILGSKHKEGFVQSYATSYLPSSVFKSRHGIFREYCKHDSCGCGDEPSCSELKLVVPISSLVSQSTLMNTQSDCEHGFRLMSRFDKYSQLSSKLPSICQSSRSRSLRSKEMGVSLIGWIKVCQSSGRLQLTDATGSLDVTMLDLPSLCNINSLYEVNDFTLIMAGISDQVGSSGLQFKGSSLYRSIFNSTPLTREINTAVCIFTHFRDTKSWPLAFGLQNKENVTKLESGRYRLLLVTHKYPMQQKFEGEQVISKSSSMFAEAILLPWDLHFIARGGHAQPIEFSANLLDDLLENDSCINYEQPVPNKKRKVDLSLTKDLSFGQNSALSEEHDPPNYCSAIARPFQLQKCLSLCSLHEVPCLVSVGMVSDKYLAGSGTLCCTKEKQTSQKVLLEFKSESLCSYELLRVGGYYMAKCYKEDIYSSRSQISHYFGSANDAEEMLNIEGLTGVNYSKAVVTSPKHLRSFSFSYSKVLPTTDAFASSNEVPCESLPSSRLFDVCVDLSYDAYSLLKNDLKLFDVGMAKASVSLEQVAKTSFSDGITTSMKSFEISGPKYHLPEGNLISFQGHVLAVQDCGRSSSSEDQRRKSFTHDVHWAKFLKATFSCCIHVLVDNHIVKIFSDLGKHAYPVGFGPGVDAAFHRILVSSGHGELFLIPTSFIEIKSINCDNYSDEHHTSAAATDLHGVSSLNELPSALISKVMLCADFKPVQFHLRVLAVYILVLENREAFYPQSTISSELPVVNIPLAGFVLDDGSSSCCLWANSDRAATLMGINGLSLEFNRRNSRMSNKMRVNNGCCPSLHRLDKVLRKHGRVIIKNYGSLVDSSCQDLTYSLTSGTPFSSSDEEVLKSLVVNACFSTFWTVVGNLMDSKAMEQLEKQLTEIGIAMHSMKNIWAAEVHYTDPLPEARRIVEKLLNS